MDPMSILFPVLSVGGMGVVFGACLGVASEVFKVEEDPRIGEILAVLPGAKIGDGCVIGAHVGPNVYGVLFVEK